MTEPYPLPAELTIYGVTQCRDELLAWLAQGEAQGQDARLSARNISEIDAAGMQLLIAATRTPRSTVLLDPSEALRDACATLGLQDWLQDHTQLSEVPA